MPAPGHELPASYSIVPSGDFINDIIIVCTLAIIIGQNLRSDLKEAIDLKKRDIRDTLDDIPRSKEYIEDESIRKLYDDVKNFSTHDPFKWLIYFYICIIASVLLNLIDLNQTAKQLDIWITFPVVAARFWIQSVIWGSLFWYGGVLLMMRHRYNQFSQKCHNLLNSLSIADKWVNHAAASSISRQHRPAP